MEDLLKIGALIADLYRIQRDFEAIDGVSEADAVAFDNAISDCVTSCSGALVSRIRASVK